MYDLILESTHIRILIFSQASLSICKVQIDNEFKGDCQHADDNLFVIPWNPERYREGLHHITVTVVDTYGRKNEVTQPFRLDEKQTAYFSTMAQILLHISESTYMKLFLWLAIFLCVTPLIFCRIWNELIRGTTNRIESLKD